jgi:hypothetical protein
MARWSKDRNIAAGTAAQSDQGVRQGGGGAANGTWAWHAAAPQDPWESLRRELDRARRYCRPLVLMEIAPQGAALSAMPADAAFRPPRRRRFRPAAAVDTSMLAFLRDGLRHGDAMWTDSGRIFVMLPEGDKACAQGLVERLHARAPQLAGAWEMRAASFPEHGFTAGALLTALAEHVQLTPHRLAPVALHAAPEPGSPSHQVDERRLRAG